MLLSLFLVADIVVSVVGCWLLVLSVVAVVCSCYCPLLVLLVVDVLSC